ncbi:TPA: hypothetical protein ACSEZ3_001779 [Streptococcus pyogenes]
MRFMFVVTVAKRLPKVTTLSDLGILENVGAYQHITSTYFNSSKTLGKFT